MSRQYNRGPIPKLDRDTCIYLAGLFDGEGCFSLHMSYHRSARKINARFRIAMTDLATIEWVAAKLDRPVLRHKFGVNSRGRPKPCYRVSVENAVGLISMIEQLLPFMITKRQVASTVLDFCRLRQDVLSRPNTERTYSPEEFRLHQCVRNMNRVGEAEVA